MKLSLVAILFFVACTSTKEVMNSWINQPQQSLILKWGPPAHIASDGGTGQVLIYSKTTYNPAYNVTRYNCQMFYVNSAGTIYHWRTENSPVPPQQVNVSFTAPNKTVITGY